VEDGLLREPKSNQKGLYLSGIWPTDRMAEEVEIKIDRDLCTGCGICIRFCPKDVLGESEELNQYGNHFAEVIAPEECIVCRRCELYCPDFAVEVEEK